MADLLLLLLLFVSLMPSGGFGHHALYVFGDSLADVGNNNYIETSIRANFPHNGVDFAGGKATGRFSNGKNTIDWLAEKLRLPSPPPYLAIASRPNKSEAFLKGINFASAGAGILDRTNKGICLSFNKQIDYFSTAYSLMVELIGAEQAQIHLSKSLFTIIIGSNDIFAYLRSHKLTLQQFVDSLISTLQLQLQKIYNFGARKFVFIGAGPPGCCPAGRVGVANGDCRSSANIVSDLYNKAAVYLLQQMKSQFTDMSYSFFNTSLSTEQIIQNPHDYGFTEVKAACCGLGELNGEQACTPICSLCPNRKNHLFWDFHHPTEVASKIFVNEFVDGAIPLVYPLNVRQLAAL